MTDKIDCPDCDGDGKDNCENCGGDGTVTWDRQEHRGDADDMTGNRVTCPACNGTGKSADDCPRCEGTGQIPAEDGDQDEEEEGDD